MAVLAVAVAAVRGFQSFRGYRPTPVPVRLEIARIGVSSGLQRLGRAAQRPRVANTITLSR